ncbi:hypothetical protein FOMPIDRAFT_1052496 [Fomitopsis schrenkii]|uniref:Uncharacterized protein n=1 Tax=Fomitopsis schrenkii TaxID=2126942 RepID=S8F6K8_FOMSC|nr:hypothetical protein FOMPIDRAFT_1052496 [Fomitopsis schrenkii]
MATPKIAPSSTTDPDDRICVKSIHKMRGQIQTSAPLICRRRKRKSLRCAFKSGPCAFSLYGCVAAMPPAARPATAGAGPWTYGAQLAQDVY